jgi:HAE1 family hydrophobic/amphiphilic exporter-1
LDQQYISNYATINIKDVITRIDGVGDAIVFGARDYSMRIWLDPAKVQGAQVDCKRRRDGIASSQCPGGGRLHQSAAGDVSELV